MQPTNRGADQPEFEIHFAAERSPVSSELREKLSALGFKHDPLAFSGVVYPDEFARTASACPLLDTHVTWSCYHREAYFDKLHEFSTLLDRIEGDVVGYAHAEIIRPEWDLEIDLFPFTFQEKISITPFALERSSTAKLWDIHISARLDSLDPRLMIRLHEELGFYFIDLLKPRGRYRIFTIQGSQDIRAGRQLFLRLRQQLANWGGIEGSIKFEQTIYWRVIGATEMLPPRLVGSASDYFNNDTSLKQVA